MPQRCLKMLTIFAKLISQEALRRVATERNGWPKITTAGRHAFTEVRHMGTGLVCEEVLPRRRKAAPLVVVN